MYVELVETSPQIPRLGIEWYGYALMLVLVLYTINFSELPALLPHFG